jgi:hypothetical protein
MIKQTEASMACSIKDMFPDTKEAEKLLPGTNRLFIGAYGFEPRSLGWINFYSGHGEILKKALIIKYKNPKGKNKIQQMKKALDICGVREILEIKYDTKAPYNFNEMLSGAFKSHKENIDEVVVDISALTKLAILVCLSILRDFKGILRIVYSEAQSYSPAKEEYEKSKKDMQMFMKFPSRGFDSIVRLKCMSSIRMQGQPVIMVAFTSFNEQLVSSILRTITPHRLIFINRKLPREDFKWREHATQEIHKDLIEEYHNDNPIDDSGLLSRVASTLYYKDTIEIIENIYNDYGLHERIICAATGTKMQTVGLFFCKIMHPDLHIEYPTPDSYFDKGSSEGVRKVYEIVIPNYFEFLKKINYHPEDILETE